MDISTGKRLELLLTLSLIVSYSHGAKVEFYEEAYYEGAKHETTSSPKCANLPGYFTEVSGSVRTDGCIMVFLQKNCKENSVRIRSQDHKLHNSSPIPDHSEPFPLPKFSVRSFRDCNELESDPKINVDIYTKAGYEGDRIEFRDMCTCQNLPRSTRGKVLSTNNHGNCFIAYTESDCKGKKGEVSGGQHHNTVRITGDSYICFQVDNGSICKKNGLKAFESIGPCWPLPEHCFGLTAVIYSVEPLQDFTLDPNSVKALAMKGSGVFRNTGPNPMTERYSAELEVVETKQFEFSKSIRHLASVSFEAGFKMTTKGGVPGVAGAEVEKDFRVALSAQRDSGITNTETRTTQKTQRFSVSKNIEIAPCTEQEVHSYVEVAKDVEMNYRVRFKVTGSIHNRTRMNANEVRKRLTQFTYVRKEDEYTLIAETTAKFKTTYGIKTKTNSTGRRIPDCEFYSSANHISHNTAYFMHFVLFCILHLLIAKP